MAKPEFITKEELEIPATVPQDKKNEYAKNYLRATKNTGRLMIFAGDQKIEHLNDDFYGEADTGKIAPADNNPRHLFEIASKSTIGVLAVQYGLAARYGYEYQDVPMIIKMNSKSDLVKPDQKDPVSSALITIGQILEIKKNIPNILGVGYTIYLGSELEAYMLSEASRMILEAHAAGLLTVLWIYPRGKAVKDEKNPHLIAGATGVAVCLGSDFVKVNYPKQEGMASEEIFKEAIESAGKTKVVCAGGSSTDANSFLTQLYEQIHVSGASGNATGRNIHQKPLDEAIRMCNAISALTLGNDDLETAMKIYETGELSENLKIVIGQSK